MWVNWRLWIPPNCATQILPISVISSPVSLHFLFPSCLLTLFSVVQVAQREWFYSQWGPGIPFDLGNKNVVSFSFYLMDFKSAHREKNTREEYSTTTNHFGVAIIWSWFTKFCTISLWHKIFQAKNSRLSSLFVILVESIYLRDIVKKNLQPPIPRQYSGLMEKSLYNEGLMRSLTFS